MNKTLLIGMREHFHNLKSKRGHVPFSKALSDFGAFVVNSDITRDKDMDEIFSNFDRVFEVAVKRDPRITPEEYAEYVCRVEEFRFFAYYNVGIRNGKADDWNFALP